MNILVKFNLMISALFLICYSYQFFYLFIAAIRRQKRSAAAPLRRYGVLISARNEETVIGGLIESLRRQNYPQELVDIFVVADNCTDNTAAVARASGASQVWERTDCSRIGKGYALRFLLGKIDARWGIQAYDGYFVFDADNLLDADYISEMNMTFSAEHRIVTSYRNSKNYGDNWISAGYGLWFLRESRYLNGARMLLGTSCAVSGTGFLVHSAVLAANGGWKYFLLTEDIEFSIDSILHGERIYYCPTARFYDEQPTSFMQSWHQRLRWSKGYLQVFSHYGKGLMSGILHGNFACYDMSMAIMPAAVITITGVLVNAAYMIFGLATGTGATLGQIAISALQAAGNMYLTLFIIGAVTTATEWKRIYAGTAKKILYVFSFPLFMFTYMPITAAAIFSRPEWRPVEHHVARTLDEVKAA